MSSHSSNVPPANLIPPLAIRPSRRVQPNSDERSFQSTLRRMQREYGFTPQCIELLEHLTEDAGCLVSSKTNFP